MSTTKKSCLLTILGGALILIYLIAASQSIKITRGLKLTGFVSGEYVFDAWTYGTWERSRKFVVAVDTFEPPYQLVLAIGSTQSDLREIELLDASILFPSGQRRSIISTLLTEQRKEVETKWRSPIPRPYAAFIFDEKFRHSDTTLELKFRSYFEGERTKEVEEVLSIPKFESRSRGSILTDFINSV